MTASQHREIKKRKVVWFITGGSTGFGPALAHSLLARGNSVAVTARDPESIADLGSAVNGLTLCGPKVDRRLRNRLWRSSRFS